MTTEANTTEKGNVARIVDRLSRDISLVIPGHQDVNLRKGSSQRQVVVCFSYSAQHDDELNLKEGDELEVLEDVESGWARGLIVHSADIVQLDKTGLFPTNFVAEKKKVKAKEIAKVIYKYDAANPDELSLPEGALITVLNKNCEDEGWYEGEYNGKVGLFPENFVKLLEPETSSGRSATTVVPPSLPAKPGKISSTFYSSSGVGQQPMAGDRSSSIAARIAGGQGVKELSGGNNVSTQQPPITTAKPATTTASTVTATTTLATTGQPDERKSMVAGLQSKLFPMGKLPPVPHKSQGLQQNLATENASSNNSDDDLHRLSSLTKNRPKQSNKRPPSMQIRNSVKLSSDESPSSPNGSSAPVAGVMSISTAVSESANNSASVSPKAADRSGINIVQKTRGSFSPSIVEKGSGDHPKTTRSSFFPGLGEKSDTIGWSTRLSAAPLSDLAASSTRPTGSRDTRSSLCEAGAGSSVAMVPLHEFEKYRSETDAKIEALTRRIETIENSRDAVAKK